jgi:hypothetical protein
MNPVGAFLTLLFSAVVFAAPRRNALLAVMAATCYVTQGQMIEIAGFHFTSIRIVLLAGILRSLGRGEFRDFEFNLIDKCFVMYVLLNLAVVAVAGNGIFYQVGCSYSMLLAYFLFRALLKNHQEIEMFIADVAILIVPFALFMMQESVTGRNVFSAFGGVSTMFRDGHFRCEAAFRSPITAGTLGATLMPLFVGLYLTKRRRPYAVIGILAATVIVFYSRSSGPLLAYGSGILALCFWRWRQHMRRLRWTVLITLVSLHLYMKAPVWFLMGHMSDLVGGGGWYRAEIVDMAVKHFSSWWFLGTGDTSTWTVTALADGSADLTNQFVAAGVRGGLISLIIFIMIFVRSYRYLGLAMQKVRGIAPDVEMLLWALGATLYGTLVNFFSVSYFDQIDVIWYLLLAMISSASFAILKQEPDVVQVSDNTGTKANDFVTLPFDSSVGR